MSVCNARLKFSDFEKIILKIFACHPSDVKTECEILLRLILLESLYKTSIAFFFSFSFLKEGKIRKQCSHPPHNNPYLRL